MALAELTGFLGQNTIAEPQLLAPGLGVSSVNQRPPESGAFAPWREPLTIAGPVVPSGRQTLYRMGRTTPSPSTFWLSWTGVVHVTGGFDSPDTTERTYYSGDGTPKWTDTSFGLAGTPYPAASRELKVPQPTIAPSVAMNADGPATGDPRRLFYCFTWVNDIGWEGAPSPPVLAPLAYQGAILDLSITEAVPAGNYGVNRVRWYRTNVVGTEDEAEFFFLREYAVGVGGMQDDARDLGADVLPTDVETLRLPTPANLKWLTSCGVNVLAGLVDKTLRYCEPGLAYAWPLSNEYDLTNEPLALRHVNGREIVLTTAGVEIFVGDDPAAKSPTRIEMAVLVSQRSVVVGDGWMAWATDDGLWLLGVDGTRRNLIAGAMTPAQWRALVPSTIAGYYLELAGGRPGYIGFYNDGSLKGFVVDLSNPGGIFMLSQGYTAGYWDALQRKLFVLDGSTLKQWDGGAAFMTATFRGKAHRQIDEVEGEWVELFGAGSTTVRVRVDGVTVLDTAMTSGQQRLPDGAQGREWQLEVQTQGSVTGLLLE